MDSHVTPCGVPCWPQSSRRNRKYSRRATDGRTARQTHRAVQSHVGSVRETSPDRREKEHSTSSWPSHRNFVAYLNPDERMTTRTNSHWAVRPTRDAVRRGMETKGIRGGENEGLSEGSVCSSRSTWWMIAQLQRDIRKFVDVRGWGRIEWATTQVAENEWRTKSSGNEYIRRLGTPLVGIGRQAINRRVEQIIITDEHCS